MHFKSITYQRTLKQSIKFSICVVNLVFDVNNILIKKLCRNLIKNRIDKRILRALVFAYIKNNYCKLYISSQ